jgi:hypothetical protein
LGERLSAQFDAPAAEVLESPLILAGTVDEIIERLERRRTRWDFLYLVVPQPATHDFAPVVEMLAGT